MAFARGTALSASAGCRRAASRSSRRRASTRFQTSSKPTGSALGVFAHHAARSARSPSARCPRCATSSSSASSADDVGLLRRRGVGAISAAARRTSRGVVNSRISSSFAAVVRDLQLDELQLRARAGSRRRRSRPGRAQRPSPRSPPLCRRVGGAADASRCRVLRTASARASRGRASRRTSNISTTAASASSASEQEPAQAVAAEELAEQAAEREARRGCAASDLRLAAAPRCAGRRLLLRAALPACRRRRVTLRCAPTERPPPSAAAASVATIGAAKSPTTERDNHLR